LELSCRQTDKATNAVTTVLGGGKKNPESGSWCVLSKCNNCLSLVCSHTFHPSENFRQNSSATFFQLSWLSWQTNGRRQDI